MISPALHRWMVEGGGWGGRGSFISWARRRGRVHNRKEISPGYSNGRTTRSTQCTFTTTDVSRSTMKDRAVVVKTCIALHRTSRLRGARPRPAGRCLSERRCSALPLQPESQDAPSPVSARNLDDPPLPDDLARSGRRPSVIPTTERIFSSERGASIDPSHRGPTSAAHDRDCGRGLRRRDHDHPRSSFVLNEDLASLVVRPRTSWWA